MIKALLFDLDNTLVIFDEVRFLQNYFKRIAKAFADLISADIFLERLINATMDLHRNNGTRTNANYFMDVFAADQKLHRETYWQRFMQFYETEYDQIKVDITLPNGLEDVFAQLKGLPLKKVIATNPIFPETALKKRIHWAGLSAETFDLITHIENMSYVKPDPGYYHQICDLIDESPDNCMMVGNDPVNDMAAAFAGLKTYLTNDAGEVDYTSLTSFAIGAPKESPPDIPAPDFKGPLRNILAAIEPLRQ